MKTVGPVTGRLSQEADGIHVDIGLPQRSRAELRWLSDAVFRRVRGMFSIDRIVFHSSPFPSDLLGTLGIDARLWTNGHVTITDDAASKVMSEISPGLEGFMRWVNEDPAIRTSIQTAHDATDFAAEQPHVTTTVLEEKELHAKGLDLLLAVGGASIDSPPRLVISEYSPPNTAGKAPLMLLGKGITFDTGGINVKPYDSYVSHMKNDMAGSALAWWLFRSLVESNHPSPVVCVLPTCENAVGEKAMRPGALVKSHRGHIVRIDHTDAEGRLAMADGLSYATTLYNPSEVITFATLTTSALISYGPYATPVHFAAKKFQASLERAGDQLGEDLHFLPFRQWHYEANRDREAHLRNTARLPGFASRGAGSRNAGHFLKHFTDYPLTHLDIFGSTWNWAGDAPGAGYGATGAPFRTLLRALSQDT